MCFRLWVAVQAPDDPGAPLEKTLEAIGFRCGLDVRTAPASAQAVHFVEVAWGDCACSLYTRKEGRDRVVGFVDQVKELGPVQLLLFQDGALWEAMTGAPLEFLWEDFRREALAALPEGRVANLARP